MISCNRFQNAADAFDLNQFTIGSFTNPLIDTWTVTPQEALQQGDKD